MWITLCFNDIIKFMNEKTNIEKLLRLDICLSITILYMTLNRFIYINLIYQLIFKAI